MGQVLNTIGIIGDGRMARHFSHYLRLSGIPFRSWARRTSLSNTVENTLAPCSTVLVLISDDAIEPFLATQLDPAFLNTRRWIHFSGSLTTPLASGFHPLMSFGNDLYDLSTYERVPFMVDEGAPSFREIFPTLKNPVHVLKPELKPLYHALCVMSGNFTTLLWQKLFSELEARFKIPRTAALPYLERIAANLREDPERALTGPLVRRDLRTLARDRAALEGDPFRAIFDAFTRTAGLGPETFPEANP